MINLTVSEFSFEILKNKVKNFYNKYAGTLLKTIGGQTKDFFTLYYKNYVKSVNWDEFENKIVDEIGDSTRKYLFKTFNTEDKWAPLTEEAIKKRNYRSRKYGIDDKMKILQFSGDLKVHLWNSKIKLIPKLFHVHESGALWINKESTFYFDNPSDDRTAYDEYPSYYYKIFAGHQFGKLTTQRKIIFITDRYEKEGWVIDINDKTFQTLLLLAHIDIPFDRDKIRNQVVPNLIKKIAEKINLELAWKLKEFKKKVVGRKELELFLLKYVTAAEEFDKELKEFFSNILKKLLTKEYRKVIINIRELYRRS